MDKQQKFFQELLNILTWVFLGACSPFRSSQKSFKKGEEKKAESDSSSSPKPAGKGETGRRPGRLCRRAVVVWNTCRLHRIVTSAPPLSFVFLSSLSLSLLMYNSSCPSLFYVLAGLPSVPLSQMRQAQPQTELLWLKSALLYRASVASKLRKVTAGHSLLLPPKKIPLYIHFKLTWSIVHKHLIDH